MPRKPARVPDLPPILVDTREQAPWIYKGARRATLKTGDYTVSGLEALVCIERKSLPDLFGTVGAGRERFKRELARMQTIEYSAIIIEGTIQEIMAGNPQAPPVGRRVQGIHVISSLASWSLKYGVHVWFGCDRRHAAALCLKLLTMAWNDADRTENIFAEEP